MQNVLLSVTSEPSVGGLVDRFFSPFSAVCCLLAALVGSAQPRVTRRHARVCFVFARFCTQVVYLKQDPVLLRDYTHPFRCLEEFETGMTHARAEQVLAFSWFQFVLRLSCHPTCAPTHRVVMFWAHRLPSLLLCCRHCIASPVPVWPLLFTKCVVFMASKTVLRAWSMRHDLLLLCVSNRNRWRTGCRPTC